jgi:hypothetical protein
MQKTLRSIPSTARKQKQKNFWFEDDELQKGGQNKDWVE